MDCVQVAGMFGHSDDKDAVAARIMASVMVNEQIVKQSGWIDVFVRV